MRRANLVLACLGLLALASASACALYFEQDPPPPPPGPPPPDIDAGVPWPPPPPSDLSVTMYVPDKLYGSGELFYLDVVWAFDSAPVRHEIHAVDPQAYSIIVADAEATMVAATMLTSDGQIVDTATFTRRCPGLGYVSGLATILEVPVEYPTIQQAIDAAGIDDIVYVHPGVYTEHLRLRRGVRLVGAGAHRTILDGQGLGENLIDFTGAAGAVVRGFTLRNVGPRPDGCDPTSDPFACSGDWYAAAVYGDGHDPFTGGEGCDSSVVLMHNIIETSDLGAVLYYHATAVIRNNLFLENGSGVLASYLDDHALVMSNTFDVVAWRFLAAHTPALHAANNIFTNAPLATESETGVNPGSDFLCNLLFDVNDTGPLMTLGDYGNLALDPGFNDVLARDYRIRDGSEAQFLGCYSAIEPFYDLSLGAYGGPLGAWYQRDITVEELERFLSAIFVPAAASPAPALRGPAR
jgi:hypothetical protein